MKRIILVFALLPYLAWANEKTLDISIVQLLADPSTYEGKRVAVSGFLKMEFEGNAIYLHEDDYKNQIYKNGFWVRSGSEISPSLYDARDGYARVEGRFTTQRKGHFGLWSGTIEEIDRVILLPIERESKPIEIPTNGYKNK
ncbi:hypothetical protein [Pelagicoccus mobilis]|uniref:Uncharacterized protein n=1 Tax=Pelagicoccus mobilis TaxID=415221 RepID=A0A934VSN4_9BACT|nr:hypothetical protein [Pelagicoccus mobilis]MBK1880612.1 hypothetical protein [Pelagicoccus mobilis]